MVCTSEFNARKKAKTRSTKKRSTTKKRAKPVSNAEVLRKLNALSKAVSKKRAAPKRRRKRRAASGYGYASGPSYTTWDPDYVGPPAPTDSPREYVDSAGRKRYAVNTGSRVYRNVRSCGPANSSHRVCMNSSNELQLNPYSASGRNAALYASVRRNPLDSMVDRFEDQERRHTAHAARRSEDIQLRREMLESMKAGYKFPEASNVAPGMSGFVSRIVPQWRR